MVLGLVGGAGGGDLDLPSWTLLGLWREKLREGGGREGRPRDLTGARGAGSEGSSTSVRPPRMTSSSSSGSRSLSVSARGMNSSLRGCCCLLGSSVSRITGRVEVLGAKVGKKGAGVVVAGSS